jgi:hypothetical protein
MATPYNFSSNFMFRSSHLAFACSRKSTVPVERDGPETANRRSVILVRVNTV